MKSIKKSSFDKLFLIEAETYHKILPLLNEMDRQELLNLNEDYKDENEVNRKESIKDTSNSNENIIESPQQFTENSAYSSDNKAIEQPEASYSNPEEKLFKASKPTPIQKPEITTRILTQSVRQKKPKKYQCGFCNKGFTTKFSLKRHNNTFHSQTRQNQEERTKKISEEAPDHSNTFHSQTGQNKEEKIKRKPEKEPKTSSTRGIKRTFQEETASIDDNQFPEIENTQSLQNGLFPNESSLLQNRDKKIEVDQKPVRISKYSNRFIKRKHQQIPDITDEENTYQKMPRIRGIKRTKTTQTVSDDDETDIKQMKYEAGMTEADFLAPRGTKRQIKRKVNSSPNKRPRWVNF